MLLYHLSRAMIRVIPKTMAMAESADVPGNASALLAQAALEFR